MKKTFIFYTDWIDYTKEMNREEKGLFLETILAYQNLEELPNDMNTIKFIWSRIKKQLDEDNNKWSEELSKRKEAGKLGGVAKASKTKQVLASARSSKQVLADNDNVNVNVNENIETSKEVLEKIIFQWNNTFSNKYEMTKNLEDVFNNIYKKYPKEEIAKSLNNYLNVAIKESYKTYRLSPYDFFKQSNGFIKFLNK